MSEMSINNGLSFDEVYDLWPEIEERGLYPAIVELMDDEIRERCHYELAPCEEKDFLDLYCRYHEEKFGEQLVIG